MAGFSDYLENKVLDYVLSGGSVLAAWHQVPGTLHGCTD